MIDTPDATATLTPFQFTHLPVRGRLLRLPNLAVHVPSLRHATACRTSLTELLAAAALLAFDLKGQGQVSLQLQHPGLGVLMLARCSAAGHLKAYANPAAHGTPFTALTHPINGQNGVLVVTVEMAGQPEARYQSLVVLSGPSVQACLADYFTNSVQTPSIFKVLAGPGRTPGSLLAGAMLLQALPGEAMPEDDWNRLNLLANTLSTTDTTDPNLPHTTLLQRLFAEDLFQHNNAIEVFPALHPTLQPDDPRPAMLAALAALPPEELAELLEQGAITMTDETSGEQHTFTHTELAGLSETPENKQ